MTVVMTEIVVMTVMVMTKMVAMMVIVTNVDRDGGDDSGGDDGDGGGNTDRRAASLPLTTHALRLEPGPAPSTPSPFTAAPSLREQGACHVLVSLWSLGV